MKTSEEQTSQDTTTPTATGRAPADPGASPAAPKTAPTLEDLETDPTEAEAVSGGQVGFVFAYA